MPDFLLYYAAFALAVLIAVALGLFPRTKWDQTETVNNLGRVHMMPAEYYANTGQSMRGVLAQERVECFLKWVMFFTVIGALLTLTRFYFRQSELIGHAAEVVAAEGFDRDAYLHAEAERTYRSAAYKGVFDDLDLEGMKRAMRRRFWIARALVAINAVAIGKVP